MKTTSQFIPRLVQITFWVIFIAQCVKAGTVLFLFVGSVIPGSSIPIDYLSGLETAFSGERGLYIYISFMTLVLGVEILKAYVAYYGVLVFKDFQLDNPFESNVVINTTMMSKVFFSAGIVAYITQGVAQWLSKKGVGSSLDYNPMEYLFMAAILYLIAKVVEKGIEVKRENDLTI